MDGGCICVHFICFTIHLWLSMSSRSIAIIIINLITHMPLPTRMRFHVWFPSARLVIKPPSKSDADSKTSVVAADSKVKAAAAAPAGPSRNSTPLCSKTIYMKPTINHVQNQANNNLQQSTYCRCCWQHLSDWPGLVDYYFDHMWSGDILFERISKKLN